MQIIKNLENYIKEYLQGKDVSLDFFKVRVDLQNEFNFGDITINAAMMYAKDLNVNPKDLAQEIVDYLQSINTLNDGQNKFAEKIEIAGPGFINLWLEKSVIRSELDKSFDIINTKYTGKNILVEHSSPNLFKPFTIGHLMNNFIGEFVVRAMRVSGADVTTMSYPSDVSLGIAKAMYILKQDGGIEKKKFELQDNKKLIEYLGNCYVRGVKKYEEDQSIEKEVKGIANEIYNHLNAGNYKDYYVAKSLSEEYFRENMEDLGSSFDNIIYESSASINALEIFKDYVGEDLTFKKSEGAIVYIPEENRKDINTTVFINSEGYPTYAGKDIALLQIKFFKLNFDYSFFITDNQQVPHFKVVMAAAASMGGDFMAYAEKSVHVTHGRMTFKGAKMSSRLGGVPSAEDTINAVIAEVKDKQGDKLEAHTQEEKDKIVKDIALAALRISILRSKPGVNIDFDPEVSLSFNGDSGPYLCYTHARCAQLLAKAKLENILPISSSELEINDLERKMFQFQEILKESIEDIAPQKLVKYLFDLSAEFNRFYEVNKIIGGENAEHNLYLVSEVKNILKKALYILGINAPEKM